MLSSPLWKRGVLTLLTVFTLSFSAALIADAKPGGSKSSAGSRGSHTNQSVPATPTAPNTLNRSAPNAAPSAQNKAAAPAPQGSFMSRFGGGIMAGLLGAGLFGLLSGSGLFSGLGGMMSILGLVLQIALLGFIGLMIYRFFKRRQEPAMAGVPQGYERSAEQAAPMANNAQHAHAAPQPAPRERSDEIGITAEDYNAFETALKEVQDRYGREDIEGLKAFVMPELLHEFASDIEANKRQNIHNQTGGATLLQGDLAESWREHDGDYASLAIRYSLFDVTRNRATGNVIEGSMATPVEITEVWTFKRPQGGKWLLSGIDNA
jgi:predicted lipid-binding transport protein (Tim44 family)